jgi:hypothetical protein
MDVCNFRYLEDCAYRFDLRPMNDNQEHHYSKFPECECYQQCSSIKYTYEVQELMHRYER